MNLKLVLRDFYGLVHFITSKYGRVLEIAHNMIQNKTILGYYPDTQQYKFKKLSLSFWKVERLKYNKFVNQFILKGIFKVLSS